MGSFGSRVSMEPLGQPGEMLEKVWTSPPPTTQLLGVSIVPWPAKADVRKTAVGHLAHDVAFGFHQLVRMASRLLPHIEDRVVAPPIAGDWGMVLPNIEDGVEVPPVADNGVMPGYI